jgi:hypothetical protein
VAQKKRRKEAKRRQAAKGEDEEAAPVGKVPRPVYNKGPGWANRFGIRPGYRCGAVVSGRACVRAAA